MNILIASDSFKGCMSSLEAGNTMARGIKEADPDAQIIIVPIADGGEGMAAAWNMAVKGEMRQVKTYDLLMRPRIVEYAWNPETRVACVEAASMLGVTLRQKGHRRPLEATSYGLGLALKRIMETEPKEIIIGLGGTGTNDGGAGLLEAFGVRYFDDHGQLIHASAQNLSRIAFVDKRRFHFPREITLKAAADVKNPYTGDQGATMIFGKQKGLRHSDQVKVEEGMVHFEKKIHQTFHVSLEGIMGAGAAGGLGGILAGVLKAELISGLDLLAQANHLERTIEWADWIFTGEGQSDAQSSQGKAVSRIALLGKKAHVPVICLSGAIGKGAAQLYEQGIVAMFSSADRAMSFESAIANAAPKLEACAYNVMRLLMAAERNRS